MSNQMYRVNTQDGTTYVLAQSGFNGPCTLRWKEGEKVQPSLARALFSLGGMVAWETWDAKSRELLSHLNSGRGAI